MSLLSVNNLYLTTTIRKSTCFKNRKIKLKDDDNTSFQQLKDSTIIITKISILLVFEENDYDD